MLRPVVDLGRDDVMDPCFVNEKENPDVCNCGFKDTSGCLSVEEWLG